MKVERPNRESKTTPCRLTHDPATHGFPLIHHIRKYSILSETDFSGQNLFPSNIHFIAMLGIGQKRGETFPKCRRCTQPLFESHRGIRVEFNSHAFGSLDRQAHRVGQQELCCVESRPVIRLA